MLTDTARRPTDAGKFVVRAVAASLGVFGLLRLSWTEAHVLLPFTRVQAGVAVGLFGTPMVPVQATLACSGADALALCLGAVFAYPVRWQIRVAGAGGGAALILVLNTLRIGILGQVAASPVWFYSLHVYVWPALLTLAIAGYVFAWMRLADRRQTQTDNAVLARQAPLASLATPRRAPQLSRRFVGLTAGFLILFSIASPLYVDSSSILEVAGVIARTTATILGILGVTAHAWANVLWTSRGGFVVTQECISTPLIPVYLAAVCAYSPTWRRLILGIAAALPLFILLGIARLLVVALPGLVASPAFVVHAFYQLLLGAVVVLVAAVWRHGGRAAAGHTLAGVAVGVLFAYLVGPLLVRAVTFAAGAPVDDPQGALAFLPLFQVGLYLAVWVAAFTAVGWTGFLTGFAVLVLSQAAGLLVLNTMHTSAGLTVHVRDVRGWAVAGPLLIVAAVVTVARARR